MDFFRSVLDVMEIPPDTSSRSSYLQLYGKERISLQNNTRIIVYDPNRLLLQCKSIQIEILGSCLKIQRYTRQELLIDGEIKTVNFL